MFRIIRQRIAASDDVLHPRRSVKWGKLIADVGIKAERAGRFGFTTRRPCERRETHNP
jgi:hypothetical protein